MNSLRILAWNIQQGGGRRLAQITTAIAAHAPDVLVLSEYRYGPSGHALEQAMELSGFSHRSVCTRGKDHDGVTVLVASKTAFNSEHFEGQIVHPTQGDFSHRMVRARFTGFDIVCGYFPLGAEKETVFDHVLKCTPEYLSRPTLLIGDLNTALSPADIEGMPLPGADKLAGLLAAGWTDIWRSRNPATREFTWFSQQTRNGFRIDQALASSSFDQCVTSVRYSHRERIEKISDHSILIVDVRMPTCSPERINPNCPK